MSSEGPVTVTVIDDHPMVRETLERAINHRSGLSCVGTAADGAEGLEQLRTLAPRVAVLDLHLPILSGLEVLAAIERERLAVRPVILSATVQGDVVRQALVHGAAGYVSKLASSLEITDAILSAARGETVMHPTAQGSLSARLIGETPSGRAVLTDREREILRRLADGDDVPRVATAMAVSPATVRTHLQNLYDKLDVRTQASAVAAALRLKLLD